MKKIVIGIDVGISTTKIVGIDDNGMVISPIRIKATAVSYTHLTLPTKRT